METNLRLDPGIFAGQVVSCRCKNEAWATQHRCIYKSRFNFVPVYSAKKQPWFVDEQADDKLASHSKILNSLSFDELCNYFLTKINAIRRMKKSI